MHKFCTLIQLFGILGLCIFFPETIDASGNHPSYYIVNNSNPVSNPSSCGLGIPIPDESCGINPLEVEIEVTGLSGNSLGNDVFLKEIKLIIDHEWNADLDIYLSSPNGVMVEISTDNGGSEDNYGELPNPGCDLPVTIISSGFAPCNTPVISTGSAPFTNTAFLPEGDLIAFNDGSDPQSGNWLLEICDDGEVHTGTLEFIELVFEEMSCSAPTAVIASNVASTEVTLNWQIGNLGALETYVEFVPSGQAPSLDNTSANGIIVNGLSPNSIFNSLNPSTEYDVYIREECQPGIYSPNSCPITILTTCLIGLPTLEENFDSQNSCLPFCGLSCNITGNWVNDLNDDFDWIVDGNGTNSSFTGPDTGINGNGKYIYLETSGGTCQNGNEARLLSNLITVNSSNGGCDMSFYYSMYGLHINTLSLEASNDCGNSWDVLFMENGNKGPDWIFQLIDLSSYDGQDVLFRFVGTGGTGFRGDIALDEINFYGSVISSNTAVTYYLDKDNDGYGDPNTSITTCTNTPPLGYVDNTGDCDDDNELINPSIAESPCNGIDDNCNGNADEFFLGQPSGIDSEICSGGEPLLSAIPSDENSVILWYDSQFALFPIHEGEIFIPENISELEITTKTTFTFWIAEFQAPFCISPNRTQISLTVNPFPSLENQIIDPICDGDTINILNYVTDNNSVNADIFCFEQNGNLLPSCSVAPFELESYKVLYLGEGNCNDSLSLEVAVKPSPVASIEGDTIICDGTSSILFSDDIGDGITPYTYQWSNGSTSSFTQVFSSSELQNTDSYTVTITSANDCTSSDEIIIETVENITNVNFSVNQVGTCNGSDGSVELEVLGGTTPYIINYEGPVSGFFSSLSSETSIQNLKQGSYQIKISDSSLNGCEYELPILVINGPSAIVSLEDVNHPSCPSFNDGCISINVQGANPTILWSNGEQGTEICDLVSGEYSVTIFDGVCSNVLNGIILTDPIPLEASGVGTPTSCFGDNDGTAEIFVSGGTGTQTITWSNGETSQKIENLIAGTYSATISDENGCEIIVDDINIDQPSIVNLAEKTVIENKCFGDATGSISLKPIGGTPPYNVNWSNGAQGFSNQNLSPGLYIATITDFNGCQLVDISVLEEIEEILLTPSPIDASCFGREDGAITLGVAGGTEPYYFDWNNQSQDQNIESLPPGEYWVNVTDENGCELSSDTIKILAPELLEYDLNIVDPQCNAILNGSISLEFESDVNINDLNFNWESGQTSSSINNLSEGYYAVTITDLDGCKVDTFANLVAPQTIDVDTNLINSACFGTQTGEISLGISTMNEPFEVQWNNGETSPSIESLAPGFYSATITDNFDCFVQIDSLEITEAQEITIFEETIENIECYGDLAGSIDISVLGGVGNYEFMWSNGGTNEDVNGLPAGSYTVTVNDENNCTNVSKEFIITESPPFQIESNLINVPECETDFVDTLCVVVTGAIAPYQYLWSNDETESCLVHPLTGDYSLTVTDDLGCTEVVNSLKVPDPVESLSFDYPQGDTIETLCFNEGGLDYSLVINGGNMPFQYIWSHGGSDTLHTDTLKISGLEPGVCNVTITDNSGCVIVSDSIYVESVEPLQLNYSLENVNCKFGQNGSIDLEVNGGTAPYQYIWLNSNGDTINQSFDQQDLIDTLAVGTYSLSLTDDNGCTAEIPDIEITEPEEQLSLTPFVESPVICYGGESGFIEISPGGGVPPYTFEWSNGSTTQNIFNLSAGQYKVTITDDNTCRLIKQDFFILEPDSPIQIDEVTITNVECLGDGSGGIDISVSGGWGNYEYFWSPELAFTEDLIGVDEGEYSVLIIDTLGCNSSDNIFEVEGPDPIVLEIDSVGTLANETNGSIEISIVSGNPPFQILWETGDTTNLIENLAAGLYLVQITDSLGCVYERVIEVPLLNNVLSPELVNSINLYPNPVFDKALLEFDLKSIQDLKIQCFDLYGKIIFESQRKNIKTGNIELDYTNIPAGSYYLKMYTPDQLLFVQKIVVIH